MAGVFRFAVSGQRCRQSSRPQIPGEGLTHRRDAQVVAVLIVRRLVARVAQDALGLHGRWTGLASMRAKSAAKDLWSSKSGRESTQARRGTGRYQIRRQQRAQQGRPCSHKIRQILRPAANHRVAEERQKSCGRCVSADPDGRARENARVRGSGAIEQVALRVSGQRLNGLLA